MFAENIRMHVVSQQLNCARHHLNHHCPCNRCHRVFKKGFKVASKSKSGSWQKNKIIYRRGGGQIQRLTGTNTTTTMMMPVTMLRVSIVGLWYFPSSIQ